MGIGMGIGMKRITQIHEKLIWKNVLNTTELGSLWSCNCQTEREVQSEGTVFPLFFLSFCQHLLVVLWEIDDTVKEPPLWSPACKSII